MPQYAAFLRAVNVGKRLVKMETLRTAFDQMGFSNVQTVIASGNVVFETPQKRVSRIEQAIENGLEDALGFDVTTFVRTGPELRELAELTLAPVYLNAMGRGSLPQDHELFFNRSRRNALTRSSSTIPSTRRSFSSVAINSINCSVIRGRSMSPR